MTQIAPETEDTRYDARPRSHPMRTRIPVRWRPALRFAWHYLEMILAMLVGMIVLSPPLHAGAAALGADIKDGKAPRASTLIMTLAMAVGMATWMWYRQHGLRHVVVMSAVMFPPAVTAGLLVSHQVLDDATASRWSHLVMAILMLAVMFSHPAAYTRPTPRRRQPGFLTNRRHCGSNRDAEVGDVLGPYETLSATGALNVYAASYQGMAAVWGDAVYLIGGSTQTRLGFALHVAPISPAGAAAWLVGLAPALARHAQSGHRQDVQTLERDRRSAAFTVPVRAAVEPL